MTGAADNDSPLVSMLLIGYRQADTIAEAVAGALAQTYPRVEILISDDASHLAAHDDRTWEAMQQAVTGYAGPHRVVLNRNDRNLGIGAHLSKLVSMAQGELLFVAAGDDVSLPQRCARTVEAWLAHERRPDLIASALVDIDDRGQTHGELRPSDLSQWRTAADWIRQRPYVIGAGQAWTKRLFDRFDPLPEGTVAEDLLMVFRAIVSGGALTLDEPLVRYRRGGISRRRRALSPRDAIRRLYGNARHAVVELPQLMADARVAGALDVVAPTLARQLARERHVLAQLGGDPFSTKLRRLIDDRAVPLGLRWRMGVYGLCPIVLAPFFWIKRLFAGRG